jgi:hypothetical protein
LLGAQIVLAVNEDGEERLKISIGGNTEYVSASSVFDVEEDDNSVAEAFKNSFSTKVEAPEIGSVPAKRTLLPI